MTRRTATKNEFTMKNDADNFRFWFTAFWAIVKMLKKKKSSWKISYGLVRLLLGCVNSMRMRRTPFAATHALTWLLSSPNKRIATKSKFISIFFLLVGGAKKPVKIPCKAISKRIVIPLAFGRSKHYTMARWATKRRATYITNMSATMLCLHVCFFYIFVCTPQQCKGHVVPTHYTHPELCAQSKIKCESFFCRKCCCSHLNFFLLFLIHTNMTNTVVWSISNVQQQQQKMIVYAPFSITIQHTIRGDEDLFRYFSFSLFFSWCRALNARINIYFYYILLWTNEGLERILFPCMANTQHTQYTHGKKSWGSFTSFGVCMMYAMAWSMNCTYTLHNGCVTNLSKWWMRSFVGWRQFKREILYAEMNLCFLVLPSPEQFRQNGESEKHKIHDVTIVDIRAYNTLKKMVCCVFFPLSNGY